MKTLSVFVDESGTINVNAKHIPYYIISIILHNQSGEINSEILRLYNELSKYGLSSNLVHTETLIFNNKNCFKKDFLKELRKKLFE